MTIEDAQRVFGKEHDMTNIQQGTIFFSTVHILLKSCLSMSIFVTMTFRFSCTNMSAQIIISPVESLPNPRHKIQDIFLFFRVSTPICVYRIRESSLLSKFNMAELQYNGIRVYDKGQSTIRALVQRST